MVTPQELQEKTFTKAVFGGYDMAAVDDYLEEVSADLAALGKENAILKSKIKVLVEKVEEYRSTEDAMRMALLTAQKTRDEIIADANSKKEKINAEAEALAREKVGQVREEIRQEEARLKAAKEATAKFVASARLLCEGQVNFLDKLDELDLPDLQELRRPAPQPAGARVKKPAAPVDKAPAQPEPQPQVPAAQPAPAAAPQGQEARIEDTAEVIAKNMRRVEADIPDAPAAQDVPAEFAAVEEEFAPQREAARQRQEADQTHLFHKLSDEEIWADDEPTSPRPKFNFDDLKFGSNYDNQ